MKQTIQINVEIPDDYTLVETEWLNNLMKKSLPVTWTMEDLIKESKLSRHLIFKRILEVPRFNKYLKKMTFGLKIKVGVHHIILTLN